MSSTDEEGSVLFNGAMNHKKVIQPGWHRMIVYGARVGGMTL
jgi:hypothetical protein